MRTQALKRCLLLGGLIATTVSCGDVARLGRAPVYLVVDKLEASPGGRNSGTFGGTLFSDVITIVTTPAPCSETNPCATIFADNGRVTLRVVPKDVGTPTAPTLPTSNNDVTINRYRVAFKRADGRNAPGVDVPYAFDGAVTGTIQAGGTTFGFELVRHVAKEESPLVQLKTSATIIATIAEITFYGQDRVGNDISVTGNMLIEFGNFGD